MYWGWRSEPSQNGSARFYIGLAAIILYFVFFLGFSRYGETRLGPPNSRPEFSTFSWASMLFAAGIGTDILFFSVAGPVSQYMHPPVGEGQTIEAAREATVWTLFHYGITGVGDVCPYGDGFRIFCLSP